jgi:ribosomal protein S14
MAKKQKLCDICSDQATHILINGDKELKLCRPCFSSEAAAHINGVEKITFTRTSGFDEAPVVYEIS